MTNWKTTAEIDQAKDGRRILILFKNDYERVPDSSFGPVGALVVVWREGNWQVRIASPSKNGDVETIVFHVPKDRILGWTDIPTI